MSLTSGTLWVVATPLGNLGDFSPRARETLERADLVLAEDTRRAGLLFQRLGLTVKKSMSYFEHNELAKLEGILQILEQGADVALISDAGVPLVSDPGFVLVRACRELGIRVSPVPGPSAVHTALMASGLPPLPHAFLGYAPRKPGERKRFFEPYAGMAITLIFFERKNRLRETLESAYAALGDRDFCIARELTKTHEEFILGRLSRLNELDLDLLGEITLVVGPPDPGTKTGEAELDGLIATESASGGSPKEIAKRVKAVTTGWTTKAIYDRMRQKG